MDEKRTVLVVEDNELNREMLSVILEEHYEVLTAENGAVGLDVLKERGAGLSLILLDIQMPVMNGYEFLEAVSGEGRFADIPIIVTTSSDSDEEQIRCLSLGASDFVVKPYKPEIVIKRVEGLIRLRETALMLHKVEHDGDTGLYNRESFCLRVARILGADDAAEYDMTVLEIESYLDLLGRYGAAKCVAGLKNLADRVTAALPDTAIVGRIDSSRLAFFTEHRPAEELTALTERLVLSEFSAEIPSVSVNAGIYQKVDRSLRVPAILANTISPIGPLRFRWDRFVALFDDESRKKQEKDRLLAESAEAGIAEKQFKVWYQPKHSAALDKTAGAEALIRWIHPEMGFISPGAFIPVFESNGFISRLDLFVVETVCSDLRRWIDEGKTVVPVSSNISQIDFDIPDLPERLEAIVDSYGLPHEMIHFEITESVSASDRERKAAAVARLHEKGFAVELDDFGSGYSNLATLGELPIDVIKLDMSLVRNMLETKHSAIMKGVLYTASVLDKKVVAEGVETAEQADRLKELCAGGVELYYQGYYYSKPLAADQFEAYLAQH